MLREEFLAGNAVRFIIDGEVFFYIKITYKHPEFPEKM